MQVGRRGASKTCVPTPSVGTRRQNRAVTSIELPTRLRPCGVPGTVGKTGLLTVPGIDPMRTLLAVAFLGTLTGTVRLDAADPKPAAKGPLSEARQRLQKG